MYHTIKIFFECMGVLSVFTLFYFILCGVYDYLKYRLRGYIGASDKIQAQRYSETQQSNQKI